MRQLKIMPSVTARTQTVDDYLRDLGKLEMITPEEETELAVRIQAGDDAAFKRMVEANLRFVVSVAKQYQNRGLDLLDLVNEGNIGLMKAALKFDPTRGFKFVSYAVWWIRQQILQALSEQGRLIRLPLNQVGILNKIGRARMEFLQENEREPTDEELAELVDITPSKLSDSILNDNRSLSLDFPMGEDQTESLILKLSFGIGCQAQSLEEIGENMDLTRERVRQLKMKAIHKLSSPKVRSRLAQYL